MKDTPLVALEGIGYWMAGAAIASKDWAAEYNDMRSMLHALVDDYLEHGEDASTSLTERPLGEVVVEMAKEAKKRPTVYVYNDYT